MFFAITCEAGKGCYTVPAESFHVSMAALEPRDNIPSSKQVSLMLENKGKKFVLCTLEYDRVMQVNLDLGFGCGNEYFFSVNGEGIIHLSGHIMEPVNMASDDEEESLTEDVDEVAGTHRRFSYGTPASTVPSLSFGAATTTASSRFSLGRSSAPVSKRGFLFGTATAPQRNRFSFGAQRTTTAASSGFAFGAPQSTAPAGGFSSNVAPQTTAAPGSFNMAPQTQATAPMSSEFSFGTNSEASAPGFSFGATPTTSTTPAPSSGIGFGTATTAPTGLSFGTTLSATPATSGFGFGVPSATVATPGTSSFGNNDLSMGTATPSSQAAPTYMSLMAELGEGPPPAKMPNLGNTTFLMSTHGAPPGPPRAIMAPAPSARTRFQMPTVSTRAQWTGTAPKPGMQTMCTAPPMVTSGFGPPPTVTQMNPSVSQPVMPPWQPHQLQAPISVQQTVPTTQLAEETEIACDGHVIHSTERQQMMNNLQDTLKQVFSSFSEEEMGLGHYIEYASIQMQSKFLLSLLEVGVANNLITHRAACESLLRCENLIYTNTDFWQQSFAVIGRLLPGVDYKGVQDLLKTILDKAQSIPPTDNVAIMTQVGAVKKVLETIIDRNTCLLPSYLILDGIQRKLSPNGGYLHSEFSKLISPFLDSFKPTAQMVSVAVFMETAGDEFPGRSKLLPVVGHSGTIGNVWKLDSTTAKFTLKGLLPYSKELLEPQTSLLRYVLEQPYSRDMVCNMLGLSKQQKNRCNVLEEQLVELIVLAMERSENETEAMEDGEPTQLLWQHLSTQLIHFVLFQYASFPHMVLALHSKLIGRNLRKGRDHLMWVLLQFISGRFQKDHLDDFLPVMKLYDLLYPEKEPLPFPDVSKASSTHALAITCIWIHLMKKAQLEQVKLQRPLPMALSTHLEYLQHSLSNDNLQHSLNSDYRISLLCNAYSTNQEFFSHPMRILVEAVQGSPKQQTALSTGAVSGPIKPLSMSILDSLTVHTKMSLIHNIVTHVMKLAQTKSTLSLAPALVETYSRLLVYNEIESLGIKGFITHLLPTVFRSDAWGILHTLLEMFSYRLHHFQPHYRVQLLNHLHSMATVPQADQVQLRLCVESTALKLIAGMGSCEFQPQLCRLSSEPVSLLSGESEELNKVLVLTLARAIHVTGSESVLNSSCNEVLSAIMQHTPHSWSSFTLACFPSVLAEFYQQHQDQQENKAQLKRSVEEEYRKWKTMSIENDIISHFSLQGSFPLFLCLLWKMLLGNDRINPIAYKILDKIGARALSAHLRTFADFLVYEFANSVGDQHVKKYVDALNDLIWKCHVIQLDRLILCLALRSFEGNEARVCFSIIHKLLLRPAEFKNRVHDFVKENSPEHWKQSDWHEKHLKFHRLYQEKFYFEGLDDLSRQNSQHTYLPVYFGNVCLRFLPVMDIVIHRFLELPPVPKAVENLLEQMGCLYKFHDRPVTYLYNTLHYYEQKLKDQPPLKRELVSAVIGSFTDIRPKGWALSEEYLKYMEKPFDKLDWIPDLEYYIKLIGRMVDTQCGKSPFPHTDWRFNEFPNPAAHALHVTCIELMALPISAVAVGNSLLDIVLKGHTKLTRSNIQSWMNAIGLVLTALPEAYWSVLHDRILEVLKGPFLTNPAPDMDPFQVFNFSSNHNSMTEVKYCYLVALTHAVWYHASFGQICTLTQLLKERFKPVINTEVQFIFLCHLVSPFLQRFHTEGMRYSSELTLELYKILESVDKNNEQLRFIDPICDLLYHIKYMFVGDSIKNDLELIIRNFRPALQRNLRFMTHLNTEETTAPN